MVRASIYVILILCSIGLFIPFLWLISTSLKSQQEIFAYPPVWIPQKLQWSNYYAAVTMIPFFRYLWNTIYFTVFSIFGSVFTAAICAYGFAKIKGVGRDFLFSLLLSTMMLPGQVTMLPIFVLFQKLGWINTYLPLIVPAYFGGGAFSIFLLRQFFRTIPTDLEEAASIDGCSRIGIFFRIILPLSQPALLTLVIFGFMGCWNSFMGPLIYLSDMDKFPLALGLTFFSSMYATKTPWGPLMAASFLMIIPMLLLFFFCQRYFIEGIVTTSGLKN